jgi:predicted amidohydrolase
MRISVAQTNPVKGDIEQNIINHKRLIGLAVSHNAGIIVFPELSLTGYEPSLAKKSATTKDDPRFDDFQATSNAKNIVIGIGIPTKQPNGICISMILFQPNRERVIYSKKYLHADEEPYFVPGENFPVLRMGTLNIGLAICYELSIALHAENAFQHGADIYIASVAKSAAGTEKAFKVLSEISKKYNAPVLYSNCIGLNDNFIASGQSAIWDSKGELVQQADNTTEGILIFDTDTEQYE